MFCPKCDSESVYEDGIYVCTFCGCKHDKGGSFFADSSAYCKLDKYTDFYMVDSNIRHVGGIRGD